ncbi:flavodoxin family protein [Methanobrevibacter sp. UBA212]|uniref:flavodoxin family protein n=1 Tax=Methanobrevibacter sp. UBA212 TaxID=1915476 RepID=UPI0025DC8D9A|nr:flavodoxin family protein [Methanobrevibacter sp. UBA212]
MKILLINGSPNKEGCVNRALEEIVDTLKKNDVEAEILWLGKKAMQDCIDCMKCVENGKCIYDDLVNQTADRMDEFDGMIIGSPVYYGGPNGRLTSFLDRLMFSIDGSKIEGKLAASVVSCRRGGASGAFERLNQYFLMTNMHIVSSQYWNQIHGFTPEDVEKDIEGLQTMRTLGENFAYLLKAQKAASELGIEKPEHEEIMLTHFIR